MLKSGTPTPTVSVEPIKRPANRSGALSPTEKVRGCFTYILTDANGIDG